MRPPPDVTTPEARRAVSHCLADNAPNGTDCWICGQELDYGLPNGHHLQAVAYLLGGDPTEQANYAPAHRECNHRAVMPPTSRQW
jgi:hypothetical protein